MARTTRYSTLLPSTLCETPITVIGVGAVGFSLAKLLAQAGCSRLILWDHDLVSEDNLGPQGWPPRHIETFKVIAAKREIARLNEDCKVTAMTSKWKYASSKRTPAIFLCVDTMKARKEIFEELCNHAAPEILIDTRMSAEISRIISVPFSVEGVIGQYTETLYSDADSLQEPCTARSTPYCAAYSAARAMSLFANYLRGHNQFDDEIMDLRNGVYSFADFPLPNDQPAEQLL